MLTPQFLLDIHRDLAVDLFAGGGGASTGIEQAIELTKKAQVRLCGNSVCPPLARAIVAANYHEQVELEAVA